MKKKYLLYLSVFTLLFSQCSRDKDASNAPKNTLDYDKENVKLMEEIAPQIVGKWDLTQVAIKVQSYNSNQKKLRITRDTVFQDFATLDIRTASVPSSSPKDLRHPDFEATIEFQGKTYPASFWLMANAERIIQNKGPQAFFLFQFNHPPGTRTPVAEEVFLEELGLMDNYSLELVAGQPAMIWKGLNRGVDKIELRRR